MIGIARNLPSGGLFWRGATLFLSNGIGQALGFIGSIVIARLLGVQSFGFYAAVMALVFVMSLLVEAGLETTLMREVAEDPKQSALLLTHSLVIKIWLGGMVALLLALPPVAAILSPDVSVQSAVQLAGPLITLSAFNSSLGAVFRAWGRMEYVLLINVAGLGTQLAGTLAILALYRSITLLIVWLIAVQALELILGTFLFLRDERRKAETLQPTPHISCFTFHKLLPYFALLRRSWPFALAGVLGALTLRVDLFLIEAIRGASQVGIYSVGTRLSDLLALAPNSFFAALLPAMAARYSITDKEVGTDLYPSAVRRMAIAGAALAVVGLLFADILVWAFFGPAYANAAGPLRVLMVALVPLLVNRTTTVHLYATHREHRANTALALNLSLRAGAGSLLVPVWGVVGAAIAGLGAECAILLFYSLTDAMGGGGGLRRLARRVAKKVLARRFRDFRPGGAPDHTVRVEGLRLHVYESVFDPKLHFTSAFLARYLRRPGIVSQASQVLDTGTGSGIAAIVAAQAGARRVVAIDINPAAIRAAIANVEQYAVSQQVVALQGDMFAPVEGQQFDLIISNPPYLRGTARSIAEEAYMGGSNLEWFDRFSSEAASYLLPHGSVLMVLGDIAETDTILERFTDRGWTVQIAAQHDLIVEGLTIYRLRPKE